METKLARLLDWLQGRPAPPTILHVHLTNRCNLDCLICPRRGAADDYSAELLDKEWLDVFEQSKKIGVARWEIVGGGEPLMRRNLFNLLIPRIKASGMEGFLISNGTLLGEDTARLLVKWQWDNVTISLDSAESATHDYLKDVPGAFSQVLINIKRLVAFRRESGAPYPYLRMNTVFGNSNYHQLLDLFNFGVELGFNEFSFQPVEIHHPDGAKIALNPEHQKIVQDQMRTIAELARSQGIPTNAGNYIAPDLLQERPENKEALLELPEAAGDTQPMTFPCYEPWYLMVIYADGQTIPCRSYKGETALIQKQGLEGIWNGKVFNAIRHELAMGKLQWFCQHCAIGQIVEDLRVRQAILRYQDISRKV